MTREAASDLKTIFGFVRSRRGRDMLQVALLIPSTAAAEMLTVGAVVPMLSILGGSQVELPLFSTLVEAVERTVPGRALIAAASLFVFLAILTALLRLALSWSTLQLSSRLAHDLNLEIQNRLLHQPYLYHVSFHSSRLLASLDKVDNLALNLVQRSIQGASAAIIALTVVAALLLVDPVSAAAAAMLVAALYGAALWATRRRHLVRSGIIAREYERRLQLLQENSRGIRDIIIDQSQSAHLSQFAASDERFMRARAEAVFLSTAPRFLVEGVGLGLIALLGLFVATRAGGLTAALPVLGALALGAQRLLPLTSQIYNAWISATASGPMVSDIAALLRLPMSSDRDSFAPLPFRDTIQFDRVSFTYPGRGLSAICDVSLSIPHGSRVAIIGKTGSGKSTLADLLMGLIEPTEGGIKIDGIPLERDSLAAWRRSIAHVPQSIFVADASIEKNIAFGLPDLAPDPQLVRRAAAIAQLDEFIATLPDGYNTLVGERGVRLSGGQRQRLAVARACYKQAPLLVLDEATSALDEATEAALLKSLDRFQTEGRTVVIIAHRRSTIERCDLIFELDHGRLSRAGNCAEILGTSSQHPQLSTNN